MNLVGTRQAATASGVANDGNIHDSVVVDTYAKAGHGRVRKICAKECPRGISPSNRDYTARLYRAYEEDAAF